jgi:5,10-methenyltetrahydrofolate synthetase
MPADAPRLPPDVHARRQALRRELIDARKTWVGTPPGEAAQAALTLHLMDVMVRLEPACLGVYWPMQGEFNPREMARQAASELGLRLALPWAGKDPVRMHYLAWDGGEPTARDGCGILTGSGQPVQPDVVLVPCVGHTASGHRLGYGGGYFDRYLAAHPEVTAIGVGWAAAQVPEDVLAPAPHDQPLVAIVTESPP